MPGPYRLTRAAGAGMLPPPPRTKTDHVPPTDETRTTLAELFAGRFTIDDRSRWGGLALVHDARSLDRELAVAVLPLDCEAHPEQSRLFHKTLTPLRAIAADGAQGAVVSIVDHGVQHGVPFIAYERVVGVALAEMLEGGPLPPRDALVIARGVLRGLERIHGAGAFHGDLTPANVLVGPEEEVRLFGLGVAAVLRRVRPADVTGPTGRGSGPAAVRYLAPEVLGGALGDAASDLYSVGALLHHMVVGAPPGKPGAELGRWERVPGLRAVVEKAMRHDPTERFPSARAFREALALEVLDEAPMDAPTDPPPPLWKSMPSAPPPPKAEEKGRSMAPWIVGGVLVLGAAGAVAWAFGGADG